MSTTSTIQMLTRYNAWANKTLFEAVAALPGSEATKGAPRFSRPWSTHSITVT